MGNKRPKAKGFGTQAVLVNSNQGGEQPMAIPQTQALADLTNQKLAEKRANKAVEQEGATPATESATPDTQSTPPPNDPVVSKNEGEGDEPTDPPASPTETAPVTHTLTNDQLLAIGKAASESTRKQEQEKLVAVEETHQTALTEKDGEIAKVQETVAERDTKIAELEKQNEALTKVFQVTGTPTPAQNNVNDAIKSGNLKVMGEGGEIFRKWEKQVQQSQKAGRHVKNSRIGRVLCYDNSMSDAFYVANKEAIRGGMEAMLRARGMFGSEPTQQAITTAADIPSINFPYLSAFARNSHFPDLIHLQFANQGLELGQKPGLEVQVSRVPYRARPVTLADRELTPGTRLTGDAEPVSELNALIRLKELGLGKDPANAPMGFSDFIDAYSMHDLENKIESILAYDYMYTRDLALWTQWFRSTNIVYNNADSVAALPGAVGAGAGGQMTEGFLTMLRSYMKVLQIPTYRDNCYAISMNPTDLGNYMKTKSEKERDQALAGVDFVTRMIEASTGREFGGEVSGYRGRYNSFHIFEQNVYGVTPGGTDPGVNNLTAGNGTNYDFLSSFAFGSDSIAWCTGLPMEIRLSSDRDFDRQIILTWVSHENAGSLDVTEDLATGEQNRVIQTRCLAAAI